MSAVPEDRGPLRLGLLGCAGFARRRALPSLARLTEITLTAVASRDAGRAKLFAGEFGGEPVAGYEELLARDDLDAVYVPLPAALHAPWTGRALEAGLHVLVEKPAAATAAEADRLTRAARERGLVVMENFGFVHHAQQEAARSLLDEGAIGELRSLTAEFAFPPLPDTDIRYQPGLGGGALLDAGVYPIRTARLFLGDELEVTGASLREDPGRGVDVAGAALLTGPTGISAHLGFGFVHSYRCGYTLWGSAGRIGLNRAYSAPDDFTPTLTLERDGRVEERRLVPDQQFTTLFRRFAAAVRDQDVAGPAHDLAQQARLVERIAATARRLPL
ncbi:Gfo/Idh/MocA family oxidoreductase [Streptomyces althioticus]|uniref:Gfo/Idh/MocA family protein n=1 Tax=Streptomyces althioticus TaxID=83380 RepID=UPI0033DFDEB2|nr:Gfo/Idh/MocA family oxidoreductase [Streptomyces althioticus]